MDYVSNSDARTLRLAAASLTARRMARGYSLEDLAVATGLTIEEIGAAEEGGASSEHVERIEHVLR